MDADMKIVGKKLILDGYIYYRTNVVKGRSYWECKKVKLGECSARAITRFNGDELVLIKGYDKSPHSNHLPNREEAEAEVKKDGIKRAAEECLELPPAAILRRERADVPDGVLSQLPERENLKKSVRQRRKKNFPTNPTSLDNLDEVASTFQNTKAGEKFLVYDSREHDDVENGRILIFATKRNLEILSTCGTWYLDGTFKVCPRIFTQVFTVLGRIEKGAQLPGEEPRVIAAPLVYALLSSKGESQYETVLRAIIDVAKEFGIHHCMPQKLMTDFEKGILNACETVFPAVPLSSCFFHLGQSMYRKVQSEGLQEAYNNSEDRTLKLHTHMILSLAFLPPDDVTEVFDLLVEKVQDALLPVTDYFEEYYIRGRRARGRRKAIPPRFPISLWNQYHATLSGAQRTNNCSEGWHNRFHLLLGKNHPDLYSLLNSFQSEQADLKVMCRELSLGKKVSVGPKRKWLETQKRLRRIVDDYETYKEENRIFKYLETLAHTIVI